MSEIYTSAEGGAAIARRYRELLADWPVPAEHLRVPTREGETFVVASGPPDAPPLLLVHGSGANAAVWLPDVAAWSQHFRVYAVDVIGEPGSSAPTRPPMALGAYAPWLDDVVTALGLTRTSLVAMSLGGWIAADYATRHPERVERLALLCPAGAGRQKWGFLLPMLLLKPFGERGRRRAMAAMLGSEVHAGPRVAADFVQLVAQHFRHRRETFPIVDDDALRRLTMPVLVIAGARDAVFDSPGTRERFERLAPAATVRLLPGLGHLLPAQTGPILEFLREARAPA